MKMLFKHFFLLCSVWFLTSKIFAFTIYISPAGDDSNPGTKDQPLASLTAARDKVRQWRKETKAQEAVEVIIEDGDYLMTRPLLLTPEDSGFPGAPVTFKAAEGARPVFYGAIRVSNFEVVNDSLWRAYIAQTADFKWVFEQLYVNGKRATRAKFPNKGFFHPTKVSEISMERDSTKIAGMAIQKIGVHSSVGDLLKNLPQKDLQNSVVTFYHKWDVTRKRIWSFDPEDMALYTVGNGMQPWNRLDAETQFSIENLQSALDSAGEWYLDPAGYLYYYPKAGEKISAVECLAPLTDGFIVLEGNEDEKVTHINFQNLSFTASGYKMPWTGIEAMQAAAPIEAAVMADYAGSIQINNCEFSRIGMNAIWFRRACQDSRVEHCYFHDLGAGGVKIGEIKVSTSDSAVTKRIVVDNNIIHSGGYVFPNAAALIIFNASDNELTHNDIADFKNSGISAGWVWGYGKSLSKRNKIEFNHIHHLGWGILSDMGGVYTLGASEGTAVSNNVIHHIYSYTYGGWGLYTDEGSTGIVMEHNLVYRCKSSAFHQHYGKGNRIRNNIFFDQIRAQVEATRIEPHIGFYFTNNIVYYRNGKFAGINWSKANFASDYNIYWNAGPGRVTVGAYSFSEWQKSGKDIHSIIEDPKFYDADRLDFRIRNRKAVSKIKFVPFDYSKAGVYGEPSWKLKAEIDKNLSEEFEQMILEHEQNNQTD